MEVVAWLAGALEDPELRVDRAAEHAHVHDHDRHHGVDSVWLPVDHKVDLEELEDALAELGREYVRIKGIVETLDGWWVVHRVGLRVSSEPLVRPEARPRGRIVALGPGVEHAPLAGCVERAVLLS